jgi:hypothetical protein
LIALVYANYAGAQEVAWVTTERLVRETGAGRSTVLEARKKLIARKWLVEERAATPRAAAHYRLTVPGPDSGRLESGPPDCGRPEAGAWGPESTADRGVESRPNPSQTASNDPPKAGTAHKNEPSAWRALDTINRLRHLGLPTDELVSGAYRLGADGDPFDGYKQIKARTEDLRGIRSTPAFVRSLWKDRAA